MNEPYCQFPLCVLAYGWDPKKRLGAILAYSAVYMGLELWGQRSDEQIEHFRTHPPEWCTSKLKQDLYLQIAMGCEELGIIPPSLRDLWEDYSDFDNFLEDWEQRHGPDPKVRIVTRWGNCDLISRALEILTVEASRVNVREDGPLGHAGTACDFGGFEMLLDRRKGKDDVDQLAPALITKRLINLLSTFSGKIHRSATCYCRRRYSPSTAV